MVELGHALVFGRGAHDHAETFRLDAADELAQADLLLGAFDFLRHRDAVAEGHEHHKAAGEGDFGGESRSFRRDGLLGYLHEQKLPGLHHVLDRALLGDVGLGLVFRDRRNAALVFLRLFEIAAVGAELRAEIKIMKKSVFFITNIEEGGVETRHDLLHLGQIEVSHRVGDVAALLLQ